MMVALEGIWVTSNLNNARLRFRTRIVPAATESRPPRLLFGLYSNREVSATGESVMVPASPLLLDNAASAQARILISAHREAGRGTRRAGQAQSSPRPNRGITSLNSLVCIRSFHDRLGTRGPLQH